MMITAIKPFEKGKNRMAIYLNDEFAFVLYKGELSKYKLFQGMELDDDTYNRVLEETLIKRARLRGMNLLKTMDRTESDVRRKLSEGGYPKIVVDNAIDYLKSFNYINDDRYASSYINFKRSSLSKKDIIYKLKEKGISDITIENALNEVDDWGETDLLRKQMLKKCAHPEKLEYGDRMKLFAYLYRKGFKMEDIERVYRDCIQN